MRFVHAECLSQWLALSGARRCEVCGVTFIWRSVHTPGAPHVLPLKELFAGLLARGGRGARYSGRLLLCVAVWLLLVPLATAGLWRLVFARSLGHGRSLLAARLSPALLFTDALYGTGLSASIVFLILAVSSLREHLKALRDPRDPHGAEEEVGVAAVGEAGNGVGGGDVFALDEGDAGEPEGAAAEELVLDELVGLRGPLGSLAENAAMVLVSNALFLTLAAFLPFTAGRLALAALTRRAPALATAPALASAALLAEAPTGVSSTGGRLASLAAELEAQLAPPQVADLATLAAGYALLACLAGLWLCVVCAWHVGWRAPASSLARTAAQALRSALVLAKVLALLAMELGAFPLLCGWWLDVCTLRLLGGPLRGRLSYAHAAPVSSAFSHWAAGIACMMHVSSSVAALRGVLRPGVLSFLRDPADPGFDPFRDLVREPLARHAARVACSLSLYGVLVVACVWTPIACAAHLAPSALPLRAHAPAGDAVSQLALDALLLQLLLPAALEQLRPRQAARRAVLAWLRCVGGRLGLRRFLLPGSDPSNRGGDHPRDHEAVMVMVMPPPQAAPPQPHLQAYPPARLLAPATHFPLRVLCLLLCAWATLVSASVVTLLTPLLFGRALLSRAGVPLDGHDAYAFSLGAASLWTLATAAAAARRCLARHASARGVALAAARSLASCAASLLLLALTLGLLPFLLGLAFELVAVAPLRTHADAVPGSADAPLAAVAPFVAHQAWAVGFLSLHLAHRWAMMHHRGHPGAADVAAAAAAPWRAVVARIGEEGVERVPPGWALQQLIVPLIAALALSLAAPYAAARGVCALAALGEGACVRVTTLAYPAAFALAVGAATAGRLRRAATVLHDALRDERYLVRQELRNFEEAQRAAPGELEGQQQPRDKAD